MIPIEGEYTTARVMGLEEGDLEENCRDQIQEMVNHPAFTEDVRIMCDTHWGAGSVIGFTMPVTDKVIPNVIGVDIGCGMFAACLGSELPLDLEELDMRIRNRVPMGYGQDGLKAPNREYYNVKEQFPWERINDTLESFIDTIDAYDSELHWFLAQEHGYDIDYFKSLCQRSGTNPTWAINSVGTLGAGNHFVEIAQSDKTGDYWVIIHSGSRGLGANTAEYWQNRAKKLRNSEVVRDYFRNLRTSPPGESDFTLSNDDLRSYLKFDVETVSDEDLLDWVQGGMGEDFVDYEKLKDDYREDEPQYIELIATTLKGVLDRLDMAKYQGELAYLEGEEAYGYYRDMIFCQEYASQSRKMMAQHVADVLGVDIQETIESKHNYIHFEDGIIRKGATPAYEGQRAVVPLNMRDGTLLVEGKGNPKWNWSVCHGAGRVMGRREAKDELSEAEVEETMDGVFTTVLPRDEAPQAYKSAALIEEAIEPTAEIVDRLEVVHNLKAP